MGDWLSAGRRVKAEWLAMLAGMRDRTATEVKLPFVPVRLAGASLRAIFTDVLPMILGENPSLLTLIRQGGRPVKAYAEGASGGTYEVLHQLEVDAGSTRETLIERASRAGVAVGVTKEADVAFFERFAEEPAGLIEALAMLASAGARALRDGLMSFAPPLPAAELASRLDVTAQTAAGLMRGLLPAGRYGIGLVCTLGGVGLVLDVAGGEWTLTEARLSDEDRDAARARPGRLARALVDGERCGLALGVRLNDLARLIGGAVTPAAFVAGRGASWEVVTRSGVEAVARLVPSVVRLAGMEEDLAACGITLESVIELARGYVSSAAAYARTRGIRLRLADGETAFRLELGASGLREYTVAAGDGADADADALRLDLGTVRKALAAVAGDPGVRIREMVPREVVDEVSYATAVCVLECLRPKGRLLLFGGPHAFLDRAWAGDACAVFLDAAGRPSVYELPSQPLAVDARAGRAELAAEGAVFEGTFARTGSATSRHGLARFFGDERLTEWLPGLEVERAAFALEHARAEFGGRPFEFAGGRMFVESGRGRLLRWPFGATWHYASWLDDDGSCGALVAAVPMLGAAAPAWWRRLIEQATDGAVALGPLARDGADVAEFASAFVAGPPARLTRDAAHVGPRELRYRVLSAAVVPFDTDGQVIFRLRCLTDRGAGLVEIPASLPGFALGASACAFEFTADHLSLRAGGRELLSVEIRGSTFLGPYVPPPSGVLARIARLFAPRAPAPATSWR